MDLTCLIKWVKLGLTFIVSYPFLEMIQIQQATFMADNFLEDLRISHEINGWGSRDLTILLNWLGYGWIK
jgi:hypothetical protein